MPFHVTARLQGREPLFAGIEPSVVRIITETAERSDVMLLAYAVMPNHLHLVMVQGKKALGAYMQVMLRRIALLVQRQHKREGHVFERRFHAAACTDAEYFRTAIAYVHLNPVRARLCSLAQHYDWTSHREYLTAGEPRTQLSSAVALGALPAFATTAETSIDNWCSDYFTYIDWRHRADQEAASSPDCCVIAPPKPITRHGDDHWHAVYGAATGIDRTIRGFRADLRDIALKTLAMHAPDMDLQLLCSGGRTRPLVGVRRQVIARALLAGYRTTQIARFLNVSSTAISQAARPR